MLLCEDKVWVETSHSYNSHFCLQLSFLSLSTASQRCALTLVIISLTPFPVMYILPVLSLLVSSVGLASAQYTVYMPHQQVIFGGNTNSSVQGASAAYDYDPTVLQAPAPPNPPVPANQFIQLYSGGMNGMSMPLSGAFFGFSIEMSMATRVRMYLPVLHTTFRQFWLFPEWEKIVL